MTLSRNTVEISGALRIADDGSQVMTPQNNARRYIRIQNPLTAAGQGIALAESLYIRFGNWADVNDGQSFEIVAGATFEMALGSLTPGDAIYVDAMTAGHRWVGIVG